MDGVAIARRLGEMEARLANLELLANASGNRILVASVDVLAGAVAGEDALETRVAETQLDQRLSNFVAGFSATAKNLEGMQQEVQDLNRLVVTLRDSAGSTAQTISAAQRLQEDVKELKRTVSMLHGSAATAKQKLLTSSTNDAHASIYSRQCRMEATMAFDLPAMRGDIDDFMTGLGAKHEAWMKSVAAKFEAVHAKDTEQAEDIFDFKEQLGKLTVCTDNAHAAIMTVRDMNHALNAALNDCRDQTAREFAAQQRDIRKLIVRANFDAT